MNRKIFSQRDVVTSMSESQSGKEADDDEVLVTLSRGDQRRFAELYDRHLTAVYRYLLAKVGNALDAEDLTSQTFLQALENLDQYRGTGLFRAWLFRIARNKSVDFYRQQRHHSVLDEDADLVDESLPSVDDFAQDSWTRDQLLKKLRTLAPDRAEAITLCFVAGLEISEVAEAMNRREPAVRMLIHRGLRDLRARMNPVSLEFVG